MEQEKHIPTEYHGYIIAVPSLFYIFATFLYSYFPPKMPKRVFIFFALVLLTIGVFLMGPSELLHLGNNFWIFLIGYGIVGAAQALLFIPVIPEVVDSVYIKTKIKEGRDEYIDGVINDKASGLYGTFLSIGLIAGPLSGSFVHTYKNFNSTCDVFAIAGLIYASIYLIFNVLIDINKDAEEQDKLEENIEKAV